MTGTVVRVMGIMRVPSVFVSLWNLFFPHRCVMCGAVLGQEEVCICLHCNLSLPRTRYDAWADNPLERDYWGKFPLGRAAGFFFYQKASAAHNVVTRLKYGGRQDVGVAMGRMMAAEWLASGFFRGMDVIVPVPLHPRRMEERGYNQSECIACGISAVTGLPVDTVSVARTRYTETQTSKSALGRWENAGGIFSLLRPEAFRNKHVLLVDDVITTTATTTALADALAGVEGIRISVAGLAVVER